MIGRFIFAVLTVVSIIVDAKCPIDCKSNKCGMNNECIEETLSSPGKLKVKHGKRVSAQKFPWNVIIKAFDNSTNDFDFSEVFGGSLINKQWVLTAAGVFNYAYYGFDGYSQFSIETGVSFRQKSDSNSDGRQTIAVSKVICYKTFNVFGSDYNGGLFVTYPFYNPYYDDICLLKLEKKVEINSVTYPVHLPEEEFDSEFFESENRFGIIAGFGQSEVFSWTASRFLTGAKLLILSTDDCTQAFQNYNSSYLTVYDYNPHTQICAGTPQESETFCAADIGGGLIFRKNDKNYIVGIASVASIIYGNDNCNGNNFGTNYTGLFTRVSAFKQWIRETIKNN